MPISHAFTRWHRAVLLGRLRSRTQQRPGSNVGDPSQTSLPTPFPFFMRCDLLLTGSHRSSKVSNLSSFPSLHYFPPSLFALPRELLLLLTGQCPNPGPSYPCPVCHLPYTRRQHAYQCTRCLAWVHSRCSGLLSVGCRRADPHWTCPPCSHPPPPNPPPPLSSLPSHHYLPFWTP